MSYHLEFRHYKYFLCLAEELHFGKAAEKLFISQPALSRQIKQMEDELGIYLFERHNRKVELTQAGIYLKQELSLNFKHLEEILRHTRLVHDGMVGNLRIGYVGSAMQKVIPNLLLKFKKQFENVHFSLNEMENKLQINALLNRDIDVGFVRLEEIPLELGSATVSEDTFSLVLPENHPINERNFKNLKQLQNEPFIFYDASYSKSNYEKVKQIFSDAGIKPLSSHYTVNANSIFQLVENQLGISIVPSSLAYGYKMKIKFIELKDIPQRTNLKAVWNHMNTNPLLVNFLELFDEKV